MQSTNEELRKEFERIVELMILIDGHRDVISSLLKDIKAEYQIEIPIARRVATIMRKENRAEEEEKWEEFNKILDSVL